MRRLEHRERPTADQPQTESGDGDRGGGSE
jgi:hypothetical protein